MEETRLRALLQELHQELEATDDTVEPASRRLLTEVLGEIQDVLDTSEPSEESTFAERLQEAVVEFENNHPRIGFTVERLIQSLSAMGI